MSTPETPISESRSSVEISENANGDVQIKIKVYADSIDLAAVDAAAQKAIQVYKDTKANLA